MSTKPMTVEQALRNITCPDGCGKGLPIYTEADGPLHGLYGLHYHKLEDGRLRFDGPHCTSKEPQLTPLIKALVDASTVELRARIAELEADLKTAQKLVAP